MPPIPDASTCCCGKVPISWKTAPKIKAVVSPAKGLKRMVLAMALRNPEPLDLEI